jgi:hypothetical protein
MATGSPRAPSPARARPTRFLEIQGRRNSLQDHVGPLRGAADLSVPPFSTNPDLAIARLRR